MTTIKTPSVLVALACAACSSSDDADDPAVGAVPVDDTPVAGSPSVTPTTPAVTPGEPAPQTTADPAVPDTPEAPMPADSATPVAPNPTSEPGAGGAPAMEDPVAAGGMTEMGSGGSGGAEMPVEPVDPEPEPIFTDPFDPDEEVREGPDTGRNNEGPTWVPELNGFVFYPAQGGEWLHFWQVGDNNSEQWFNLGAAGHPAHYNAGFVYAGVRSNPARIVRIDVNTRDGENMPNNGLSGGGSFATPQDMDHFSDDSIFFTDWPGNSNTTGIYRLYRDGTLEKLLSAGTINALQLSPDCRRLYTSHGDDIDVHDVAEDGSISNRRNFYNKDGVNGVGIDSQGNLIVGGSSTVDAVNQDGEKVGELNIPFGGRAVNFAYGGEDGKTLFITLTGGGTAWTRTRVRGSECNGLE